MRPGGDVSGKWPLRPEVWEWLSRSPLFLDQTDARLELDREQVEQFYQPLATWLLEQSQTRARLLAAVAGPPGSGKTALATTLVQVLNAETGQEIAVLVGLDGWHYDNAYLDAHVIERDGQRVPLRRIKGAPESFDVAQATACLSAMRSLGEVRVPVYSRQLHEPVPEASLVSPSHRIVVVEGNYLLLDEPEWRTLGALFDVRLFVTAPEEVLLEALRERHRRGGKRLALVEAHMRAVDLPNARRVATGALTADVIIHKSDVRHIRRLEWL
jgi:pantothenate kinase